MNIKKVAFIRVLLFLGTFFIQQVAFATVNDLIMILDPHKNETIKSNSRAMTWKTLLGLKEEIAPIIVSSNILEVITYTRQQLGDAGLQHLQSLVQTTSDSKTAEKSLVELVSKHNLTPDEDVSTLRFLSFINFNNNRFNYYFHKTANLVLLIPKQYIATNFPNAINLNPLEQAQACGFNPATITVINNPTIDSLLRRLQIQESIAMDQEKFINSLTALFIPQKQNKWAIYLTGHGSPAQSLANMQDTLNQIKLELKMTQIEAKYNNSDELKNKILFLQNHINQIESMLAKNKNVDPSTIIPESATIAGLNFNNFVQLMQFFNQSIHTAYVHYSTCFGGGYNQTFVNEVLSMLNVNFIVSSEGISETYTEAVVPIFAPNDKNNGLILNKQFFSQFFTFLNLFVDKPEEFIKTKGKNREPLAIIIGSIAPNNAGSRERNQPFVRIPNIGTFGATMLNNAKILTQTFVKAHEIENRPIDLSCTENSILIVNPSRINTPININCAAYFIVSPTPKNIIPSYEAIHIFKKINYQGNDIHTFLFALTYLNARFHPQTFIINHLTGVTFENQKNSVNNFIIQIKGILGTNVYPQQNQNIIQNNPVTMRDIAHNTMGGNVTVAFESNGKIYQSTFGVKTFQSPDLLSFLNAIQKVTFTSTPVDATNMEELAQKVMSQEEVNKLQKPITLDSIVKYFDAKIDKQGVITPEMQEQSTIGLSALRK